jgi:spore germination cell wall hydrolase CwlJ-like protein
MKLKLALIALLCASNVQAKMHNNKHIKKVIDNEIYPMSQPLENQTQKDVMCLAYSIYREAGNLSVAAQYAVGQIHINRLLEGSWGSHLCQVVFAKAQFSWTLEKKVVIWSKMSKSLSIEIADSMVNDGLRVKTLNSKRILHYHANYVDPKWGNKNKAVAVAGAHIFYKDIAH